MSQHSSLKTDSVGKKHRNVLKRFERLKKLHEDDMWGSRESAYKLPKVKMLKIKMKKEKSEPKAEEGEAGTAAVKPPAK
jgi:small basic protein (TIGR04137 family)